MNSFEQKRHYPDEALKHCTNRACSNYRRVVRHGKICNECGHEVRLR